MKLFSLSPVYCQNSNKISIQAHSGEKRFAKAKKKIKKTTQSAFLSKHWFYNCYPPSIVLIFEWVLDQLFIDNSDTISSIWDYISNIFGIASFSRSFNHIITRLVFQAVDANSEISNVSGNSFSFLRRV